MLAVRHAISGGTPCRVMNEVDAVLVRVPLRFGYLSVASRDPG